MLNSIARVIGGLAVATACLVAAPPVASAADDYYSCERVTEVMEKSGLIHVKCADGWNQNSSIVYFAISTSDSDNRQDHFISMASAAILSGRTFRVYVIDSTSGLPSGCSSSNCRRVTYFGLR